jgi:hypothetical protein
MAARRQAQPTGVIETLSAGYTAVNRQLWVLLLPIILDVFLWVGPHVSYSPLVGPVVTQTAELTRQVALSPRRATRNVELATSLDQGQQWLLTHADDVNGLSFLAWGPVAMPSLGWMLRLPSPSDELSFVSGWVDGVSLLIACAGVGLLLGAWFYRGLAAASTQTRGGPLAAGRDTPRAVLDVLGLAGVVFGAALLLGVPVALLIGFTALVSPPIAALGGVFVVAGVLFAIVHLSFAVDAIFVSNAGPLAAIQHSVVLVRKNLQPSLALILLSWLILGGMTRVWDLLANNLQPPYGVALGILGNAYIASGLIAAGMIFYSQRTEASRQLVKDPVGAPTRGTT